MTPLSLFATVVAAAPVAGELRIRLISAIPATRFSYWFDEPPYRNEVIPQGKDNRNHALRDDGDKIRRMKTIHGRIGAAMHFYGTLISRLRALAYFAAALDRWAQAFAVTCARVADP